MESKSKICVSIGNIPFDTIPGILDQVEMAEIRLDLVRLNEYQIETVFSSHGNLIATCREGELNDDERAGILSMAIEAGAAWVDIETDSDNDWRDSMIMKIRSSDSRLILSKHYFTHTPPPAEMRKSVDEMFGMNPDIVKIACQVNNSAEAAAILGMYFYYRNLVAIGMGPLGVITRLAAPLLGAPFTFASFSDNPVTAAGQIEFGELSELIERISSYG